MTDRGVEATGAPPGHIWVKMLSGIAGLRFSYDAGQTAHFPKAMALQLIEAGQAEAL